MSDKKVVDYLLRGQENAIPARQLADLLGYKDLRTLRSKIEVERRNGAVILSSVDGVNYGYYLPGSQAEVDRYIAQQSARIKTSVAVLQSAKQYQRLYQPGQMYIARMAGKKSTDTDDAK